MISSNNDSDRNESIKMGNLLLVTILMLIIIINNIMINNNKNGNKGYSSVVNKTIGIPLKQSLMNQNNISE